MKTCSLYRLLASLRPADSLVGRVACRHFARCADCRDHRARVAALETRLVCPTHSTLEPLPSPLRLRILETLPQNCPHPPEWRSGLGRWWLPVAGAAATCMLALLWIPRESDTATNQPGLAGLAGQLATPVKAWEQTMSLPNLAQAVEQPFAEEVSGFLDHGRQLLADMIRSALPQPEAEAVLNQASQWFAAAP